MTNIAGSLNMWVDYSRRLSEILNSTDWAPVAQLGEELLACWRGNRQVFICGNGGSAGNAIHLANDLLYGIAKGNGPGLRVYALPANPAVITCFANDCGYEYIFARQVDVLANEGDILIVLSGSGNSPNVLRAVEAARRSRVRSFGILGYNGGRAKELVEVAIHFPIDDMQISEDLQLIVGHMIMQYLYSRRPGASPA